mmetsp:Transcript_13698/g.41432  ORF Transcript_13698/g.41432 Transcript_13698/m.41432 type:complete len:223 (-) Transcript_13698:187-855(-)
MPLPRSAATTAFFSPSFDDDDDDESFLSSSSAFLSSSSLRPSRSSFRSNLATSGWSSSCTTSATTTTSSSSSSSIASSFLAVRGARPNLTRRLGRNWRTFSSPSISSGSASTPCAARLCDAYSKSDNVSSSSSYVPTIFRGLPPKRRASATSSSVLITISSSSNEYDRAVGATPNNSTNFAKTPSTVTGSSTSTNRTTPWYSNFRTHFSPPTTTPSPPGGEF